MAEPTTELQKQVMRAAALQAQTRLARRRLGETIEQPLDVTTAELTARTGRVGQVIGHAAGELMRKGLLRRTAPATYRLTREGVVWLQHEAEVAALAGKHAVERAELEAAELRAEES